MHPVESSWFTLPELIFCIQKQFLEAISPLPLATTYEVYLWVMAQKTTYDLRLSTFAGYWDQHDAAARQLAAIGHVYVTIPGSSIESGINKLKRLRSRYDRPPLARLEEGTRCISCSAFVRRELSVQALQGAIPTCGSYTHKSVMEKFNFHDCSCQRLQLRIPLNPAASYRTLQTNDTLKEARQRRLASTADNTSRIGQGTPLLALPAELKHEIFSQVLPKLERVTEIVLLSRDSNRVITKKGDERGLRSTANRNLLGACRTIHREALDLFYSNVTYRFTNSKVLYLFLRNIGVSGRQLLKRVDIVCGGREDAIAFALLSCCTNLISITIRLPRLTILPPEAPLWCIEGMTCLLSLRGLEKVDFDAYDAPQFMNVTCADAQVIMRELTQPIGAASGVRNHGGYLDV